MGVGGAEAACAATSAGKPRQTAMENPSREPARDLVQSIDGETAEELGKEVGGFLGHDFTGKRDFAQFGERGGLHEEGDVGLVAYDLIDGFSRIAEIANVGLPADVLGADTQDALEDDGMKLDGVEAALAFGKAVEGGVYGFRVRSEEVFSGIGNGDEGGFCRGAFQGGNQSLGAPLGERFDREIGPHIFEEPRGIEAVKIVDDTMR